MNCYRKIYSSIYSFKDASRKYKHLRKKLQKHDNLKKNLYSKAFMYICLCLTPDLNKKTIEIWKFLGHISIFSFFLKRWPCREKAYFVATSILCRHYFILSIPATMTIWSQVHLIFLQIRPSKLNLILSKDDEERCYALKDLFKNGYIRDPFYQVSKPWVVLTLLNYFMN